MKTVEELKPLKIYSSGNKLYLPTNDDNKKNGSCIMVFGNPDTVMQTVIGNPITINKNRFKSYYMDKDVEAIINHEGMIAATDEADGETLHEDAGAKPAYKVIKNPDSDTFFKYKATNHFLSHFRSTDDYDLVFFVDPKNKEALIGAISVQKSKKIIQALEVSKDYRGNKYSHLLLDYCVHTLGAREISVKKTNSISIALYLKNGFKTYKSDETMMYMRYTGQIVQDEPEENDEDDDDDFDESAFVEEVIKKDGYVSSTKCSFNFKTGSDGDIKEAKRILNPKDVFAIQQELNNKVNMASKTVDVFIYKTKPGDKERSQTNPMKTIHIQGKNSWKGSDAEYDYYVRHELVLLMIYNLNPMVNKYLAIYTAMVLSGQMSLESIRDDDTIYVDGAKCIEQFILNYPRQDLIRMLRTNDIHKLVTFASKQVYKRLTLKEGVEPEPYVSEVALSSQERNKLPDSDFGIPETRQYPMNDAYHVKLAIKCFNHVDKKYEKELAENIKKKMKEFNVEVEPGENNRFSDYI